MSTEYRLHLISDLELSYIIRKVAVTLLMNVLLK